MISRLFLASALCALLANGVGAQTVAGRVIADTDGIPLRNVSVSLLLESGDAVGRTLTDDEGRFVLQAPTPGVYRVVADHLGYRRLESPLATVGPDQMMTIDFELPIDPIEVEGIGVEVQRRAELKRRIAQYGVSMDHVGARFIPRSEIERRPTALNIGQVLQWQNLAGVTIEWSNSVPPALCVKVTRLRASCATVVLDGNVVSEEFAASIPLEMLEAVLILTPVEATLSYGTDGDGAVLLFTRAGLAGR